MYREILDEYLSQLEILTEKIERFKYRLEEIISEGKHTMRR